MYKFKKFNNRYSMTISHKIYFLRYRVYECPLDTKQMYRNQKWNKTIRNKF